MNFISVCIKVAMIVLALALVVYSSPLTDNKRNCQMNCELQDYKPICGTDDAGVTRTFNNICILKTENCLRTYTFQKTGDGVCP
uniref:Kazal-like domain-containing protein n=1 Tax=Glossina morsitans morsitans TaxID=37546 RepID=D3TRR0_GLOMM